MRAASLLVVVPLALSCTGSTGYRLVSFYAAAVGPADARASRPYTLAAANDRGFRIELDTAVIHIGAVYLDQSVPTSGQQQEPCTLPGTYVGEVRGGRDFDMLSSSPQLFPVAGDGSTIPAAAGQVWLTHGDVFAAADPLPVLTLDGFATRDGAAPIHFQAALVIDQSRTPAVNSALPGEHPICVQRIVSPIPLDITLAQSGTLLIRLDPSALFIDVDFSTLLTCASCPIPQSDGSVAYGFTNDSSNQASINLYRNLTAAGSLYRFEWQPAAQ
jgi:hypothetical protein